MKRLKVSFDFDGTITASPDRFVLLSKILADKCDIYIITGRPASEISKIEDFLKSIGFSFLKVISFPRDYLYDEFDHRLDYDIGLWKAKTIKGLQIDIAFEDHPIHSDLIRKYTNVLLLKPAEGLNKILASITEMVKKVAQEPPEELPEVEAVPEEEVSKYLEKFKETYDYLADVLEGPKEEISQQVEETCKQKIRERVPPEKIHAELAKIADSAAKMKEETKALAEKKEKLYLTSENLKMAGDIIIDTLLKLFESFRQFRQAVLNLIKTPLEIPINLPGSFQTIPIPIEALIRKEGLERLLYETILKFGDQFEAETNVQELEIRRKVSLILSHFDSKFKIVDRAIARTDYKTIIKFLSLQFFTAAITFDKVTSLCSQVNQFCEAEQIPLTEKVTASLVRLAELLKGAQDIFSRATYPVLQVKIDLEKFKQILEKRFGEIADAQEIEDFVAIVDDILKILFSPLRTRLIEAFGRYEVLKPKVTVEKVQSDLTAFFVDLFEKYGIPKEEIEEVKRRIAYTCLEMEKKLNEFKQSLQEKLKKISFLLDKEVKSVSIVEVSPTIEAPVEVEKARVEFEIDFSPFFRESTYFRDIKGTFTIEVTINEDRIEPFERDLAIITSQIISYLKEFEENFKSFIDSILDIMSVYRDFLTEASGLIEARAGEILRTGLTSIIETLPNLDSISDLMSEIITLLDSLIPVSEKMLVLLEELESEMEKGLVASSISPLKYGIYEDVVSKLTEIIKKESQVEEEEDEKIVLLTLDRVKSLLTDTKRLWGEEARVIKLHADGCVLMIQSLMETLKTKIFPTFDLFAKDILAMAKEVPELFEKAKINLPAEIMRLLAEVEDKKNAIIALGDLIEMRVYDSVNAFTIGTKTLSKIIENLETLRALISEVIAKRLQRTVLARLEQLERNGQIASDYATALRIEIADLQTKISTALSKMTEALLQSVMKIESAYYRFKAGIKPIKEIVEVMEIKEASPDYLVEKLLRISDILSDRLKITLPGPLDNLLEMLKAKNLQKVFAAFPQLYTDLGLPIDARSYFSTLFFFLEECFGRQLTKEEVAELIDHYKKVFKEAFLKEGQEEQKMKDENVFEADPSIYNDFKNALLKYLQEMINGMKDTLLTNITISEDVLDARNEIAEAQLLVEAVSPSISELEESLNRLEEIVGQIPKEGVIAQRQIIAEFEDVGKVLESLIESNEAIEKLISDLEKDTEKS